MNKTIHPIEPEELMAYLDGELSTDDAVAAAVHLENCPECRSVAADLQSVSQTLKTWEVRPSGPPIPQVIATALEQPRPEPRKVVADKWRAWPAVLRLHWKSAAAIGAFAGIVVVVGLIGGRANMEQAPVVSTATYESPRAAQQTRQFDQIQQFAKLQRAPTDKISTALQEDKSPVAQKGLATGPMIIRTAELTLTTKEFDKARASVESTLKRHLGYVGELKVTGAAGSGRTLTATLRVPADQLDATLAELKTLGRVESESQGGEDVSSQYVDLQARLANARNTEQRLTDLLRNRTGKLSDVLEVEQELDRVRGEIEQMEAERKNMATRVSFATVNATITEDYKAQLQMVPPSTSTRLSNAAVEGYRSAVEGILSLALFLLSTGPSLLLWAAILFLPARFAWKRMRRGAAQ